MGRISRAGVAVKTRRISRDKKPSIRPLVKRLFKKWANLSDPPRAEDLRELCEEDPEVFGKFADHPELMRLFHEVRGSLRKAWGESDLARRQWWLWEARRQHEEAIVRLELDRLKNRVPGEYSKFRLGPPDDTLFNKAMVCLQMHLAKNMRVCQNDNCPTPCFFWREKADKSCSEECRTWHRKEYKSAWEEQNRKARSRRRMEERNRIAEALNTPRSRKAGDGARSRVGMTKRKARAAIIRLADRPI